jgi:hypothetical protein
MYHQVPQYIALRASDLLHASDCSNVPAGTQGPLNRHDGEIYLARQLLVWDLSYTRAQGLARQGLT